MKISIYYETDVCGHAFGCNALSFEQVSYMAYKSPGTMFVNCDYRHVYL